MPSAACWGSTSSRLRGFVEQFGDGQEDMAVVGGLVEGVATPATAAPASRAGMPSERAILSAVRKPMP